MSDKYIKLFSTWFYIGKSPFAGGSFAAIAGILMYMVLRQHLVWFAILTIVVTVIGFMVSRRMEEIVGSKDPGCIVIDEVAGSMIAVFMLPITPAVLVTAFFLFRACDMFKLYPANKCEDVGGSVGVMMDDVLAGVYTCVTMHAAIKLSGMM